MSFAAPWALLLALIPVAGLLLQMFARRRTGSVDSLPAVLRAVAAGGRVRLGSGAARRPWRCWLALVLLALALARPQWGVRPDDNARRDEVVIALDLSRSMLATDDLPSRVERARTIATRLVAQSPAASIGLIAFAGQAFLVAAPSPDRALLLTFLPAVAPEQMAVPGSNFADLLRVVRQAFDHPADSRTLVLLSDGEAEPTPWRQALPALRERGIHVVAVGLGTAAGASLHIAGGAVTSRLDAATLRAIAGATGGAYLEAAQAGDLAARVRGLGEAAAARRDTPGGAARQERFGWPLLAALLLLLWSAIAEWPALPRLWPGRHRRRVPAALTAAVAVLLPSPQGRAGQPPPRPDALAGMKRVVRDVLARHRPSADDYGALAQATLRYADASRTDTRPLQRGVIRDGLAAVDAGRALDPQRPDWAPLRVKLVALLRLPRRADDPEEGDGEMQGQPEDPKGPRPDNPGSGPQAPPQPSRTVGGTPRSGAEQTEWQVPSLVKPLYTLQKLHRADQPCELFRLIQLQEPPPLRRTRQTW